MPARYISSSISDSTTSLLYEQRSQKDYAAAFGILADTCGFSIPNGVSRAPPPSPVDATYSALDAVVVVRLVIDYRRRI
ncbi:hypothetical protein ACEPAF_9416 [Sanghuangporus sanghuang]